MSRVTIREQHEEKIRALYKDKVDNNLSLRELAEKHSLNSGTLRSWLYALYSWDPELLRHVKQGCSVILDPGEMYKAKIKGNLTHRELSEKYGVSCYYILNLLKKLYKENPDIKKHICIGKIQFEIKNIYRDRIENELSLKDLSLKYGFNLETISRHLCQFYRDNPKLKKYRKTKKEKIKDKKIEIQYTSTFCKKTNAWKFSLKEEDGCS